MIRFEDLLEKVRAYSPEADLELLRRAYVFSAFEHRGQVRRSGEPYLIHPLAVAEFLVDLKLDVVAISAGLLHDVVEDTLTTPERIAELFGPEIAHVVEGVTKIGAIPFSSSEERQAENFRKMLLAMVDDIRYVILLSQAGEPPPQRTDATSFARAAPSRSPRRPWTSMRDLKSPRHEQGEERELEGLVVPLSPSPRGLPRRSGQGGRQAARRPESVIGELTNTIRGKLEEAQVPIIQLDGRIKRLYSIHLKLKRQKIDIERVYDFVAIRVIRRDDRFAKGSCFLGARHHSPDMSRRYRATIRFIAMPLQPAAAICFPHLRHQRSRCPLRGADPHRGDTALRRNCPAAHWKYQEEAKVII